MHEILARNVNDAWQQAIALLSAGGVQRDSRFGPVLEFPEPVVTRYQRPWERVLFDPIRDANPFLHFFEGLWMLAGREDVAYVKQFSTNIGQFSDNGTTFHGAYGRRWRDWFQQPKEEDAGGGIRHGWLEPIDQLKDIIGMLRANPDDRRAVLQMWDAPNDFNKTGKDFPCNTHIYFKVRKNRLYMTVCNRSNDIVWGCYGANAVHMSMLHQYVAEMCGFEMGPYHQMSDSWHGYLNTFAKYRDYGAAYPMWADHYVDRVATVRRMVHSPEAFDAEVKRFVDGTEPDKEIRFLIGWVNSFFPMVALPLYYAWRHYKERNRVAAMESVSMCDDSGWRIGCTEWLERRKW